MIGSGTPFREIRRGKVRGEPHPLRKRGGDASKAARDRAAAITGVWPPGCNGDGTRAPAGQRGRTGCLHHYDPGQGPPEGCTCPRWFDGGGTHLVDRGHDCTAHTERTTDVHNPN